MPNGETSVATVRIWNETVSNLTLMALGSSAPEILLSVIEVHTHTHTSPSSSCFFIYSKAHTHITFSCSFVTISAAETMAC